MNDFKLFCEMYLKDVHNPHYKLVYYCGYQFGKILEELATSPLEYKTIVYHDQQEKIQYFARQFKRRTTFKAIQESQWLELTIHET